MYSDSYETLLHKHLSGELSETEERDLKVWLNASPDNRRQLEEAERIWALTESAGSDLDINLDHEIERFKQRVGQQPTAKVTPLNPWSAWRYAAVVVVLMGVIALFWQSRGGDPELLIVETVAGETRQVNLPDQSTVWLNESSRLAYNPAFEVRTLELEGEAFFDVEHDPAMPFTVEAGAGRVQVLGTSFNVRYGTEEVRVIVATGRVALSSASGDSREELTAGYQGVLRIDDSSVLRIPNDDPAFLSWRNRSVAFDATPFDEVVETLRTHFAIVIEDPAAELTSCTLTGEFGALNDVLQAISFTLGLDASVNQGIYAFSGVGCSQ